MGSDSGIEENWAASSQAQTEAIKAVFPAGNQWQARLDTGSH
jgi:hypothetical protein